MKKPDISACTYFSFKTPKGRFIDIFYGTVTETYFSRRDIEKQNITSGWWGDVDVRSGFEYALQLIESKKKYKQTK